MTGFTVQEVIISGLYLWETRRMLQPNKVFQRERTRQVILHLIWVNIFIVFLDLCLLATEYANLFTIQTVFKAAIYSLKLRLEFDVLNQLKQYVQGRSSTADISGPSTGLNNSNLGGRSIPLEARSGQDNKMNGGREPDGHKNYSVYASKGSDRKVDLDKGVMMTKEVHVHHGSPSTPSSPEEGQVGTAITTSQLHFGEPVEALPDAKRPASPSSSQIEFAGRGV